MKSLKTLLLALFILFNPCLFSQSKNEKTGEAFLKEVFNYRFDKARKYLDETMAGILNESSFRDIIEKKEAEFGKFQRINSANALGTNVIFNATFKDQLVNINISFNDKTKIQGLFFNAGERLTQDASDIKYNELKNTEIRIAVEGTALPGTLTQPISNDKKILVVFVHGSGPNDRDETSGPNKVFKQLATALAYNGITSYRYDKKSNVASQVYKTIPISLETETTNDAVDIVKYFRNKEEFKLYKIYIVGHSQGAYAAPQIAEKLGTQLDGIVMMAAPARRLENMILEQVQYQQKNSPSKEMEAEIKKLEEQVAYMNSSEFTENSPANKYISAAPAAWWLSFHKYDHIGTFQKLNTRIFIAQGENDYQVTLVDYGIWKEASKNKASVTMKSYPKLMHTFMPADHPSMPDDYEVRNTISEEFVNDLSNWLTQ